MTDETGAPVVEPRVDILSVSIDNTLDEVQLTVEVGEVVDFKDEAWTTGALTVAGGFRAPRTESQWEWIGSAPGGVPQGTLTVHTGVGQAGLGCVTDLDATATAYVFTATGACADGIARSIEFGGAAVLIDGFGAAVDLAPDQPLAGGSDEYFDAAATEAGSGGPTRLAGTDRILTAIALSQDDYGEGEAGGVVIASSEGFPDALAGGPLAAYLHAPLLLTGASGLDPRTRTELQRVLEPGGVVYVLGGTAALSAQVITDVQSSGYFARRLAGLDRFATAVAVADAVDGIRGGYETVLLADGRTFTDALLAGAAAPGRGGVVLLTDGATMPAATADRLAAGEDGAAVYAIGAAAAAAAPSATPITGTGPSDLSVNVAALLTPINGTLAVASQTVFADALGGGPHIAHRGGPLLLTAGDALAGPTARAIADAADDLRRVVIYGGTAAISTDVEASIRAAMRT